MTASPIGGHAPVVTASTTCPATEKSSGALVATNVIVLFHAARALARVTRGEIFTWHEILRSIGREIIFGIIFGGRKRSSPPTTYLSSHNPIHYRKTFYLPVGFTDNQLIS